MGKMYYSQHYSNYRFTRFFTFCVSRIADLCAMMNTCGNDSFILYNRHTNYYGEERNCMDGNIDMPESLLNVRQVSKILGLSYNGTYKLINSREIRSVKIGTRRLFTPRAVNNYIKSLEDSYEA